MSSRTCKREPNDFCYICGHYIRSGSRKYSLSGAKLQQSFEEYFHLKLTQDIGKPWAPQFSCATCTSNLTNWQLGKRKSNVFKLSFELFYLCIFLI